MFDSTLALLEKSIEMRMKAHELHVSNVANANVPGYKAKNLEFKEKMQAALRSIDGEGLLINQDVVAAKEAAQVEGRIYEDPLAPMNGDGNTVSIEKEQAELAKNYLAYQTSIQLLNKKIALQKYVLTEGAR